MAPKRTFGTKANWQPPETPTEELSDRELWHYRRLRAEYIEAGCLQIRGESSLVNAAIAAVNLERHRLGAETAPLFYDTENGPKPHPVFKNLENAQKTYHTVLTALGLTPKSRNASRVTKADLAIAAERSDGSDGASSVEALMGFTDRKSADEYWNKTKPR